jgi:hypothetical protein
MSLRLKVEDATGLPRGGSRWPLHPSFQLASLDATGLSRGGSRWPLDQSFQLISLDATGLSRGGSRSQLNSRDRENSTGQARGILRELLV